MSKITKQEEEIEEYKFPEYTNQELWTLNTLLDEKYNGGNKIDDITKWMADEGAVNKYGAVVVTGFYYKWIYPKGGGDKFSFPYHDYPTKYALLQDKLEKANKLLGRKEFAQKKELEDLNKLAESMKPN